MNKVAAPSFAVGISLTANHGAISVHHGDGLFEDLGRIDGDDSYLELMRRLSSPTARHPSPPYNDMEELWKDWPRQAWRTMRKRLGLPASSDVAVLSDMLKKLAEKASSHSSSGSLNAAVISYPAASGLYQEDIVDAADYLGIRALRGNHLYQPREMVAAYAGHGMGLCKSFKDKEKCTTEGLQLPVRHTLLVEYTEAALLLHAAIMREAVDLASSDIDIAVSFELGSHDTLGLESAIRVREFLLQLLRTRYRVLGPPERIMVIMTGSASSMGDTNVLEAIEATIKEFGSKADMITSLPEFVAARGAATLAWRSVLLDEQADL